MLELPVNRWLEATLTRHSHRRFDGTPLAEESLEALDAVSREFRPFETARVELVRAPSVDVFKGAVGNYGNKVTGAPSLLVMITSDESFAGHRRMAYTSEGIVLEATALGAETCWVGGFFRPQLAGQLLELGPHERVAAVSPLGHAATPRAGEPHHRKPLAEIAPGSDAWPVWARKAAESGQNAPSAVNRQPWRFALDGDTFLIRRDNRRELLGKHLTKALDCGIASLHVELAARAEGIVGEWVDAGDERGLEVCRYVTQ